MQVASLQLNTHAPYVCGFEQSDTVAQTCAWLYGVNRMFAETTAVSRGTSHAITKQRCKYKFSFGRLFKNAVYEKANHSFKKSRAHELCQSRGSRPGLPSLISLTVSVAVKQHERRTYKIRAQ